MPLVAPLILPFAELAGITIAGLGMAAASKKVSDFISDNPEISTQILTTLVPGGVGLNALFKDKDAPSTKDIVLGELGKEKGNYSSPNAEEAYSSKRGRIIKALEEAGKIKKGPDKDYDSSKKYKGYKKFYEKADGGAIGTPYDAIATTQDFTNALDKVGAGTDLQKAVAIGEYGQNARRQNPFKNLGFLDTQRHFDNNQLLKNAVTRGELSSADYNRLGGFDVAQTMGAGNPVLGGIGNLIGSTGYNIVQSLKGNQSPFDIPGDVFRNVQGGTGLISDDLKTQYESIINSSTPTPNASTDRPTMADVAGPGTSNNLLSLFERYKDIQTPAGADPNNPDFVGETALGNIERGISDFLKSDRGLKYGKDIPLDINDIYSFIEAQRRSFSPDLSQNYQGGNLYNYLQDFYQYKYGNPRIELPSGNYGYYDEQGPDGPVSNERENIFKSYFNQPYKYGLKDGGAIGIEVLFEEKKDGGRIGFANGGIENIIGKNLDNITNVAKGLDKEMLDMTFDDKYYRDKIQPAKLGQAPIPGRMEMMLKSKPFTAVGIGMRPGTFGERAQPTKAASQFLNTLGKGAKFVGTKVGPLSFMDIFASTPLGADDEVTDEMRQSIEMSPTSTTGIMVDANDGFRTSPATYYNSAPNFNADVLREEEDAQYNLPQKNIFQRAGNFIGKLNLEDYLPFIGQKSLTGTMGRGIGNLFQNIAPARYGTSQRAYNALTPQGRSTVGSIYGPGGIMSGYNAVSAFGRGPLESITNRISKTRNPVIKEQLITAAKKITDSGQDTSKTGINAVTRKGTYAYDDVNVGGSGTGGSGGKIVCTMMNESYGFGNFRNKIWLKHSKDLPKEYEIGYHTIFLPLVNFAKKEGKVNKLVKKILEHIAKHRTIDLKQEMRGKTHTLGRVYRKILEPICLMVGKIKKEVK
jgi:hypothetical protein